jgi:hypothetical protein
MTTFDEVLVGQSVAFMKKAKADGKPFFVWHNPTRMHVWSFICTCEFEFRQAQVSSEGDARKIVSENLQVYLSQSGASVDREASSARRLIEAALSASRRPSINEDV